MTVRNLEFLFHPKSIAVVAEPDEPGNYAAVVLRNLAAGGFAGAVASVAAKKRSLFGLGPHLHIDEIEIAPDLAIVCAALSDVPQIIAKLGARGTRAAIVGPLLRDTLSDSQVLDARKAILDAARPWLMRVLGPGSGGVIVPASGLNASVAPVTAVAGKIALITQSAAIAAAVLDRAASKNIGFSSVLHLGTGIDIDLADALDWLAADPDTDAILVQFDAVAGGRKFMSAARAAARNKPVVAIRGRSGSEGTRAASRPFTADDVYEAALRRCGWVRIDTLEDMFDAAEAMARVRPMRGERLGIVANGGGLGRIAAKALLHSGGRLATLAPDTVQQLATLLHPGKPPGNPLALPADITPANWAAALSLVIADPGTDAVLTVCSPSPFAPGTEVAAAISEVAQQSQRNVFTCWVGGNAMQEAQRIAAAHGVLSHDSPEKAIAIFSGIVNYERNRNLLVQMPPSVAEDFKPDDARAHGIIAEAIALGADVLPSRLARALLEAYGIAAVEYPLAGSVDAAILSADEIGYPVDLGLVLSGAGDYRAMTAGLRSPADIRMAARNLRANARAERPGQRISGYRLRPSAARGDSVALRLGVADDPIFGPVIFLGPASGSGRADDLVIGLPPLNRTLAEDLVERSGFAGDAGGEHRAALETALATALVRLSQLLTDLDQVAAMELDPLHVEAGGAAAFDARIRIERRGRRLGFRRFAIRPYPRELEQVLEWQGRRLLIRPIRPEDETTLAELITSLKAEDSRMRFFGTMRKLPRSQLARFTQIDYDREMSLVAIERGADGVERSLGEVRAVADPDNAVADFAILVRSDMKGKGLGTLLLARMVDYCRSRGTGEMFGETLSGNLRMKNLARDLGFTLTAGADLSTVELRLRLHPPGQKAPAAA
jgi:acetyltransferase